MWNAPLDNTNALAVADVDGDGDVDVLTCNDLCDRLYFNGGTGHLAEVAGKWPPGTNHADSAEFADVDGDGDFDAVLGGGGARLFRNDGTGGFTEVPGAFFATNAVTFGVAVGDIDGDGDVDAVFGLNWATGLARTLRLFVNDGSGTFTEDLARFPGLDDYCSAVALADFDADGDLDLARSSNPALLLLNDGHGFFTQAPGVPPAIGYTFAMQACDTDGDRDLDLVCAQGLGHARVPVNTTRQLAWRTLPRIGAEQVLDLYGPKERAFRVIGAEEQRWIPMEPLGVLRIARRFKFTSQSGVLDAAGRAQVSWPVPLHAQLIGRSLYWQAWFAGPPALSNLEITTFLAL
jgi:hypothetical protein